MSTLASTVLSQVTAVLQETDGGGVAYTPTTLLRHLNEGQTAIAMVRPQTSMADGIYQLTAGKSSHDVTDYIAAAKDLVSLDQNWGSNGTTAGIAITLIDRALLDVNYPAWRSMTGQAAIKHYCYDGGDALSFDVFPPVHASTPVYVSMSAHTHPAPLTSSTDALNILDEDVPALVCFILYRALGGEREDTPSHQRAREYFQDFASLVGLNVQSDTTIQQITSTKPVG